MDHRRDDPHRRRPAGNGHHLSRPSGSGPVDPPVDRPDEPTEATGAAAAEPEFVAKPEFDVAVLGLGPAGRALAYCCARRGLRVAAVDPNPDRVWLATYGCWRDELPAWLSDRAVAHSVDAPIVRTQAESITVDRGYVVLDNAALRDALALDSVRVIAGSVDAVRPSVDVGFHIDIDGTRSIGAAGVIDARGVATTSDSGPPPALQTAFGVVVPREVAAPVLDGAEAVLMDWRSAGDDRPGEPPSFLYAVPLSGDRVLLEETCLIGRPGPGIDRLRVRLRHRLRRTGLDVDRRVSAAPIATETVRFAMAPAGGRPWRFDTAPSFGARGGLGNPATGYSVATALREAEVVARVLAARGDPVRALWSWRARLTYRMLLRAATVLEDLDTARMQDFFAAFFAMPVTRQRAFLSDRRHPLRVAAAMTSTFVHVPADLRPALIRGVVFGDREPTTG